MHILVRIYYIYNMWLAVFDRSSLRPTIFDIWFIRPHTLNCNSVVDDIVLNTGGYESVSIPSGLSMTNLFSSVVKFTWMNCSAVSSSVRNAICRFNSIWSYRRNCSTFSETKKGNYWECKMPLTEEKYKADWEFLKSVYSLLDEGNVLSTTSDKPVISFKFPDELKVNWR